MNLAQYHFDNDLLARDNDSLKLDSDESAPDWIAVECFTKLKNQELPQEEIGSDDFLGVKGGGGGQGTFATIKLRSEIPFGPVSGN